MALPSRWVVPVFMLAVVRARAWELRWADEFDGTELNSSLWTARADSETPPGWNQIECYQPANVAVGNGSLWLTARLENTTCGRAGMLYNVTSGAVDSMFKANASFPMRIEVRARMPNAWAYGLHSSAWLVGYSCWPTGAEIDVYEYESEPSLSPCGNGTQPSMASCYDRRSSNYHLGESCGVDDDRVGAGDFPKAPFGDNPVNFSASFRVASAEVNSTHACYYDEGEDGQGPRTLVAQYYVGMPSWPSVRMPSWDMYVILSHAYMARRRHDPPSWVWQSSGSMPPYTTHEIDYVRVYGQ